MGFRGKRQAVVVTHIPSGISACCDNGRSVTEMREKAIKLLKSRLWAAQNMIHIDPEEVIVEFLNEEDVDSV